MDRQLCSLWRGVTLQHLLAVTGTLLLVSQGQAGGVVTDGRWRKLFTENVLIAGHFASFSADSLSRCASECLEVSSCQSFAFRRERSECWLYATMVEYSSKGSPSPRTSYFASTAPGECPSKPAFQEREGACFLLFQSPSTWSEAGTICKGVSNGRLFVADTPAKMAILTQETRKFWVGSTDTFNEGDWRWVNGRSVTDGWGAVPAHDVTRNCMYYDQGKLWNEDCDVAIKFLCEVPL